MGTRFIPYQPDQQYLMPCALQEWLPQGHLAYFINDTVDRLDLRASQARYARGGPRKQSFHPAMMAKVLVYALANGVFSSQKIARKRHEDVAFWVLAADNFPVHRTIRDFLALHLVEFTELFTKVVRLARETCLVKLGTIAMDVTKVKANASRHNAMSCARMQSTEIELNAQIAALLKKAGSTDEAEKEESARTSLLSWSAGRPEWRPLKRPKRACKSANVRPIPSACATMTTSAAQEQERQAPRRQALPA